MGTQKYTKAEVVYKCIKYIVQLKLAQPYLSITYQLKKKTH